jgi:1,4-dihydroxy-2-naphthoate polyprenyltransferase
MISEPQLGAFPNAFAKYLAATRPPFLSVTLVACLIGLAVAAQSGFAIDPAKAFLTIIFALVAGAGANVINDYHDALNGSDAANTEHLFPFTGGSRFIQNGILDIDETRRFGFALLASVVPPGLWLAWHSAPGLLLIGLLGLLVGWAYSAPPFKLMCRGLGEAGIVSGWLLVVIGSDFVQRGSFAALPLLAGLSFALLVANILHINQYPDRQADARVGKRTLVVQLGAQAWWIYGLIALLAYAALTLALLTSALPWPAALALITLPLSLQAARQLRQYAATPAQLTSAIKLTILAANLHGLLLAGALAASAFSGNTP